MGCDIHMFMQRRKNPKAKWELHPGHVKGEFGLEELGSADRWYSFFGHLAGVRGDARRPIASRKGLPKNCPDEIREQSLHDHSHSYCNLNQFETAMKRALKDYNKEEKVKEDFEEIVAEDSCTTLFYDYHSMPSDDWPNYYSILRYCRKWIWETKVENGLAGIKSDLNNPQIRFIYFFDS